MLYKGKASSLSGVAVARASYPGEQLLVTNIELSGQLAPRDMEQREKGFLEEWEPLSEGSGIWGSPAHTGLIWPKPLEKQGRNEKDTDSRRKRIRKRLTATDNVLWPFGCSGQQSVAITGTMRGGTVCHMSSQLLLNAASND